MGRTIYDSHAHVAVGKAAPAAMGRSYQELEPVDRTEYLIREMDAHGIQKAVLMGSYVRGSVAISQSAVQRYPDRFVAFCAFDRGIKGDEAARQVERWLNEPEFKGVGEIGLHNFYLPGKAESLEEFKKELPPVMEVAERFKVPVLFHTGFSATNPGSVGGAITWRDPFHLDEFINRFRSIPIILGHAGGHYPPFDDHAIMLAFQYDHVYLELSKSRTDVVERVVREIGSSKLLWGSDWVRETPHNFGPVGERESHMHGWNLRIVEEANISDDDKDRIFWRNLSELLGI